MKKTFIFLLCISLLLGVCSCVYETPNDTSSGITDSSVSDTPSVESSDDSSHESDDMSNEFSEDISKDASREPSQDTSNEGDVYNVTTAPITADAYVREWYKIGDFAKAYAVVPARQNDVGLDFYYYIVTDNDGNAIVDIPFEEIQVSNGYGFSFVGRGFDKNYYGFTVKNTKDGIEANGVVLSVEMQTLDIGYGRLAEVVVLPTQISEYQTDSDSRVKPKYINASFYYTTGNGLDFEDSWAFDIWGGYYDFGRMLDAEQKKVYDEVISERNAAREKYYPALNPGVLASEESLEYFQLPDSYYIVKCLKDMGYTLEQLIDYKLDESVKPQTEWFKSFKSKYGSDMFLSQITSPYTGFGKTYEEQMRRDLSILYEGDHDTVRRELADVSACYYDGRVYNNFWLNKHPEILENMAKDGYLVPVMDFVSLIAYQHPVKEFKEYDTDYELPVETWSSGISPYALKYYKQYS